MSLARFPRSSRVRDTRDVFSDFMSRDAKNIIFESSGEIRVSMTPIIALRVARCPTFLYEKDEPPRGGPPSLLGRENKKTLDVNKRHHPRENDFSKRLDTRRDVR